MDVFFDVSTSIRVEHGPKYPGDKGQTTHGSYKHHPEPKEQVNLFVEQVYRQHALYSVTLDITKTAYLVNDLMRI